MHCCINPDLVSRALVSPLHIHVLAHSADVVKSLKQQLYEGRHLLYADTRVEDFIDWLRAHPDRLDCLILDAATMELGVLQGLAERAIWVPTIILSDAGTATPEPGGTPVQDVGLGQVADAYHSAVIAVPPHRLDRIDAAIQRAIQLFIALPADSCILPVAAPTDSLPAPELLSAQQERLTDKLKARLGYLGVYYKRNSDNFLRNMSQAEREKYLSQLKVGYRKIVLGYFSKDPQLNQNIDDFVNQAFFADIAVSYIVEIHMDLMEEFSKQLKLEGRSEEILLDYRLTLIDVIAHLCEMYRRSIPRQP